MAKTAFAHYDNRIAPVFDVARHIRIIETESGRIVAETENVLASDIPVHKAIRLAEMGVRTLVCGAISKPFHEMVAAYGIQVVPFVAGDLRDVIQAWLGGGLAANDFVMPGCCGRIRCRKMSDAEQEGCKMNGKKQTVMAQRGRGRGQGGGKGSGGGRGQGGGKGSGGGKGRGQGGGKGSGGGGRNMPGAGSGQTGGAGAYSGDITCTCPNCGYREPHERGIPCLQKRCPTCGVALIVE